MLSQRARPWRARHAVARDPGANMASGRSCTLVPCCSGLAGDVRLGNTGDGVRHQLPREAVDDSCIGHHGRAGFFVLDSNPERVVASTIRGDLAKPADRRHDDSLGALAAVARELELERSVRDAETLADRVAAGRFYVACVGQFKRGKSTLLNALVNDPILPTGFVPVTAVPTVLRYGAVRAARVRIEGADWRAIDPAQVVEYVSEARNPQNAKRVDGVEVLLPSPLLSSGMCLVDTPGLGSVFSGNTEMTRAFIPHIDAAIVVFGADPPLAADELALVDELSHHIDAMLFALNKADRVSDDERAATSEFARSMLERQLGRAIGKIFQVSAIDVLRDGTCGRDWLALRSALDDLVHVSGAHLARAAGRRGVERIARQLLAIIQERRDALIRPMAESERRVDALDRLVRDAEQSASELGHLFTAEQERVAAAFGADAEAFLADTLPIARAELAAALATVTRASGPAMRREMLGHAQSIAWRHLAPWLLEQQDAADDAYRRISARFVDLANGFLDRLASAGNAAFATLGGGLDAEHGLRVRSGFYFNDLIHLARPASPVRLALDTALGVLRLHRPIERDADAFLERLLSTNAARVEGDVADRVYQSRRLLEAEVRALIRDVHGGGSRALAFARAAQAAGADAVRAALDRLATLEEILRNQREAASDDTIPAGHAG